MLRLLPASLRARDAGHRAERSAIRIHRMYRCVAEDDFLGAD
jgi:hypothetical protein